MKVDIRLLAFICLLLVLGALLSKYIWVLSLGVMLSFVYCYYMLDLKVSEILKGSALLLPFIIMLFVTWGIIVQVPPNMDYVQSRNGALQYALETSLTIWIIFISFYSLSKKSIQSGILESLECLGLPTLVTTLLVSSLTIFTDLKHQFQTAYDAMLVRGVIRRNSVMSKLKNIPSLLRIVFITGLRISIRRSELWEERSFFHIKVTRENKRVEKKYLMIPFVAWLLLSFATRFV